MIVILSTAVTILWVSACGSTGQQATTAMPTSAAPTTPFEGAAGIRVCSQTDGKGTYYLDVTSQTEHDFRVCSGGTTYNGTLDDLFKQPGMDRRCIVGSNEALARNHALVGVYSDTGKSNLAAARAYCESEGGSND
jgi:hypothetical protein